MVKSGLVDRPDVSHYRLAVHLTTAFLTCSYTLWVALDLIFPKPRQGNIFLFNKLFLLFVLIIAQIVYGAFVAGLKAGIYQSLDDLAAKHSVEREFAPELPEVTRNKLLSGWKAAIQSTLKFLY